MSTDVGLVVYSWRDLLPIIRGIYARSSVGCCWHVVLDDENIDDGSRQFCAKYAVDQKCEPCIEASPLLLAASLTQLSKARKRHFHRDSGNCGEDGCEWCDRG